MPDDPNACGFMISQEAYWPHDLVQNLKDTLPQIWQAFAASFPNFPDQAEASLLLSNNQAIRVLNKHWRGYDKPTNVLSFPSPAYNTAMPDQPLVLGDIILAIETLEQEAAELDISSLEHTTHLLIHGLLHLLGHDHDTEEAATRMEDWETQMMLNLGFSAPYYIPTKEINA